MNSVFAWVSYGVLMLLTACTSGVKGNVAATSAVHTSSSPSSGALSSTKLSVSSKPNDPNDTRAWITYLGQIVQKNTPGINTNHLYPYFVPAGNTEDADGLRQRQLEMVRGIVARGVPPGVMLVFAGPDSGKTREFVTEVFKDAQPDLFKNVIILVVGDVADRDKVTSALQKTGATVRYAIM